MKKRLKMDTKSKGVNNVQQVLPTKIKLCGYLKKKRTKVGGWRKMWFVLQDKLLLSYVSKEEYDNKLVSFKDVLNLVPGTVVRPLGGFRFTIETTSQAMYTFYCDDRVAYREWISMLLLSIASQTAGSSIVTNTKVCNFSPRLASISVPINSNQTAISSSYAVSYSSVCQKTEGSTPVAAHAASSVRLPIAQKTAKILERNGMNTLDSNPVLSHGKLNKSCTVCLSFSQTEKSGVSVEESHFQEDFGALNQPKCLNDEVAYPVSHIDRMTSTKEREKSKDARQRCSKVKQNICTDKIICETVTEEIDERTKDLFHRNSQPNDRQQLEVMQESLCRLTIKGSKEIHLEMSEDWIQRHNKKTLLTKTSQEQLLIRKKLHSSENLAVTIEDTSESATKVLEPVYAVVDLKNKYAQRKMRNSALETKRCNSYDSIIHNTYFPAQSKSNLYDKEEVIKSSCDYCDVEAIYEDGEFLSKDESSYKVYDRNEEENIYEPINVTTMHKNAFLSYLNRLKINSILQLNRIRKKNSDSNFSKPDERYFDLKHKNGSTRKSIKVRMRKLCFREYEPKPFFNHSQQPVYGSAATVAPVKKLKTKWKSVKLGSENRNVLIDDISPNRCNKRIFGSLPHLRKTRISIFSNKHLQGPTAKDENKGNSRTELQRKLESTEELNIVESNGNC